MAEVHQSWQVDLPQLTPAPFDVEHMSGRKRLLSVNVTFCFFWKIPNGKISLTKIMRGEAKPKPVFVCFRFLKRQAAKRIRKLNPSTALIMCCTFSSWTCRILECDSAIFFGIHQAKDIRSCFRPLGSNHVGECMMQRCPITLSTCLGFITFHRMSLGSLGSSFLVKVARDRKHDLKNPKGSELWFREMGPLIWPGFDAQIWLVSCLDRPGLMLNWWPGWYFTIPPQI